MLWNEWKSSQGKAKLMICLRDWKMWRSESQAAKTCLNFLVLFSLSTVACCSYTQMSVKYLLSCRNSLHEPQWAIWLLIPVQLSGFERGKYVLRWNPDPPKIKAPKGTLAQEQMCPPPTATWNPALLPDYQLLAAQEQSMGREDQDWVGCSPGTVSPCRAASLCKHLSAHWTLPVCPSAKSNPES